VSARHQVKRLDRISEERSFKRSPLFQNRSGRRNKFFFVRCGYPYDPQFHRAQSPARNLVLTCSPTPSFPGTLLFPGTLPFPERPRSPERPLSPERSDSPRIRRPALKSSPVHIDRSQPLGVSLRPLLQARHRSRVRYPARGELPNGRRSCARPDHLLEPAMARRVAACPVTNDDDTDLAAMVIVLPNRRVNQTSRLATSPCAAGIFAIPCFTARCARLHPVHREP
jgi:hypothetical protein